MISSYKLDKDMLHVVWSTSIFRFHFRDGQCDPRVALGVAIKLYVEDKVDGIVGIPCASGRTIPLRPGFLFVFFWSGVVVVYGFF